MINDKHNPVRSGDPDGFRSWKVVDWNDYPPLPDDAEALIEAWIEKERRYYKTTGGTIRASDALVSPIAARRPFAVFGDTAHEIGDLANCTDDGLNHAYRVALMDNTAYYNVPPEGGTGVLYWLYSSRAVERGRRPWSIIDLRTPWLYARELLLPPEEIRETIVAEAEHENAKQKLIADHIRQRRGLNR